MTVHLPHKISSSVAEALRHSSTIEECEKILVQNNDQGELLSQLFEDIMNDASYRSTHKTESSRIIIKVSRYLQYSFFGTSQRDKIKHILQKNHAIADYYFTNCRELEGFDFLAVSKEQFLQSQGKSENTSIALNSEPSIPAFLPKGLSLTCICAFKSAYTLAGYLEQIDGKQVSYSALRELFEALIKDKQYCGSYKARMRAIMLKVQGALKEHKFNQNDEEYVTKLLVENASLLSMGSKEESHIEVFPKGFDDCIAKLLIQLNPESPIQSLVESEDSSLQTDFLAAAAKRNEFLDHFTAVVPEILNVLCCKIRDKELPSENILKIASIVHKHPQLLKHCSEYSVTFEFPLKSDAIGNSNNNNHVAPLRSLCPLQLIHMSDYFRALFLVGFREHSQKGSIQLHDINVDTFDVLISYLEDRKAFNAKLQNPYILLELTVLTDMWNIKEVYAECLSHFENFIESAQIADLPAMKELLQFSESRGIAFKQYVEKIAESKKKIIDSTHKILEKNVGYFYSCIQAAKDGANDALNEILAEHMMKHFQALYTGGMPKKHYYAWEDDSSLKSVRFSHNATKLLQKSKYIQFQDFALAPPIQQLKEAFSFLGKYVKFVPSGFFKRLRTDDIAFFMQHLPSTIQYIDLSKIQAKTESEISVKLRKILQFLPSGLKSIKLDPGINFGDQELEMLVNRCSQLQAIEIKDATITSIRPLARISSLKIIKLPVSSYLKEINCLKNCTQLEELDLSYSHCKDYEVLNVLVNLKRLSVRGCTALDSLSFLKTLDELKFLDIRECAGIKDLSLLLLLEKNSVEVLKSEYKRSASRQQIGDLSRKMKNIHL